MYRLTPALSFDSSACARGPGSTLVVLLAAPLDHPGLRVRLAVDWVAKRLADPSPHWPEGALRLDRVTSQLPEQCAKLRLRWRDIMHVDSRVTFEVLIATFGLEGGQGLVPLAAMVHALDFGGAVPAEGKGYEAILSALASV